MDELHDGDILQFILDKKDNLITYQIEVIELLKARLQDEQLKNANLYKLLLTKPNDQEPT